MNVPLFGGCHAKGFKRRNKIMLAGASAVMVGTANFINPAVCEEVVSGIETYLKVYNYNRVDDIIAKLQLNG